MKSPEEKEKIYYHDQLLVLRASPRCKFINSKSSTSQTQIQNKYKSNAVTNQSTNQSTTTTTNQSIKSIYNGKNALSTMNIKVYSIANVY